MLRYSPLLAVALAGCQPPTTPPALAQKPDDGGTATAATATAATATAATATAATATAATATAAPTIIKSGPTALDAYLKKPEPAFKWSDNSAEYAGYGAANLKMVSQTWQGHPWSHRLQIFKPTGQTAFADAAVLNIAYGDGGLPETILGQGISDISGAYAVNVFNVPNQPLYGREEDALVALSFQKYLETGDTSWPLLLPMTKSVTKAMDALQEWSLATRGQPFKRFIVSGASKRGWTAYLVAAGDRRVVGCAPIVYDNLNIPAQIKHQREVWGETSQLAVAFSNLGLMDEGKTASTRGQELLASVDPYSYLDRLTMPILSINATNDGYWPHDAQTIYRQELGKHAALSTYYAPNSTHFLGGEIIPLAQSAASWSRLILAGHAAPTLGLKREGEAFSAQVSGAPTSVKLWMAKSSGRDFRHAHWVALPMKHGARGWQADVPRGALQPFGAAFAQAQWPGQGTQTPLVLASPMWTSGQDVLMARAF